MPHSFTHDVIIIGQGLAGVALSETLARRGLRVVIFDVPKAGQASAVAAGMVNPIVLRRTVPSWRAGEMLAIAEPFYQDLGARYKQHVWHPTPMVALFPTAHEQAIWQQRTQEPEVAPFLDAAKSKDPAVLALPQPAGHGVVKGSAWLDVRTLLALHRSHWLASGQLVEKEVSEVRKNNEGVEVQGCTAPLLVRCTGPFQTIAGMVPVRGEGLTVRIPGLGLKSMVHRGIFILPLGNDLYRVGATYAWSEPWIGPTEDARTELLNGLERLVQQPVEVVEHWAGVRPATRDRRPILGRIGPHEAVFNGLGSRGVLLAPWCAQHLADHLFSGADLDSEVDLGRF